MFKVLYDIFILIVLYVYYDWRFVKLEARQWYWDTDLLTLLTVLVIIFGIRRIVFGMWIR